MEQDNFEGSDKGQVKGRGAVRKPLTEAEKERRRLAKLRKTYPDADFSQLGSDPEPSVPDSFPPSARDYIIKELRRKSRSGKKAYGKHMSKKVIGAFGHLSDTKPEDIEGWINWICRNRQELISGKYAPSNFNNKTQPLKSNVAPSPHSEPQKSEVDGRTDQPSTINEIPAIEPRITVPHSQTIAGIDTSLQLENSVDHEMDNELAAAVGAREPLPPTIENGGMEASNKVADELSAQPKRHIDGPSIGQPNAETVEGTAFKSAPNMPDKPSFKFMKEGTDKANKFFSSIYFDKSLEVIRANARDLSSDKQAVDEVFNRGPIERDYLTKAMHDLQVPLP